MKTRILLYILLTLFVPLLAKAGEVPDSVVQKMQKEKAFRYANDPSYWPYQQKTTTSDDSWLMKLLLFFVNNAFMKWIMYAVLALVVLFIIYQVLVVNNFFSFSRRRKHKSTAEEGIETEENIDEALHIAIKANDWRAAVRYLYLKTLVVLSEKNLIVRHAKSTNYDYLNQMSGSTYYRDFAQLTLIYEYVWYGEFAPTTDQFEKIHSNFNHFISLH